MNEKILIPISFFAIVFIIGILVNFMPHPIQYISTSLFPLTTSMNGINYTFYPLNNSTSTSCVASAIKTWKTSTFNYTTQKSTTLTHNATITNKAELRSLISQTEQCNPVNCPMLFGGHYGYYTQINIKPGYTLVCPEVD